LEIGEWLRGLGLQSYEQAFRDHGIDFEVLPHLTVDDLKEIGVQAVGHRRKILEAINLFPIDRTTARAPASAERRQLTIMFVDLVGSIDLSRRVDPEELREIMRSYQNAAVGEIARLGGHVAKFLGDGILAYFGWPQASEDATERAVRAGLAVAAVVGGMSAGAGARLKPRSRWRLGQAALRKYRIRTARRSAGYSDLQLPDAAAARSSGEGDRHGIGFTANRGRTSCLPN